MSLGPSGYIQLPPNASAGRGQPRVWMTRSSGRSVSHNSFTPSAKSCGFEDVTPCHCRQAWESFAGPEADLRAVVAALRIPVWYAWARHDRVIPLSLCRAAIDATPGAALTLFNAGHAPFLEQPRAFARDFLAFAERLDRAPAHLAAA